MEPGGVLLRTALLQVPGQLVLDGGVAGKPRISLAVAAAGRCRLGAVVHDGGVFGTEGIGPDVLLYFVVHGEDLVPVSQRDPRRKDGLAAAVAVAEVGRFEQERIGTGFPALPKGRIGLGQMGVGPGTAETAIMGTVNGIVRKAVAVLGVIGGMAFVVFDLGDHRLGQRDDALVIFILLENADLTPVGDDPGVHAVDAGRAGREGLYAVVQFFETFFLTAEGGEHDADLGLGADGVGLIAPLPVDLHDLDGIIEPVLVVLFVAVNIVHHAQDVQALVVGFLGSLVGLLFLQQPMAQFQGLLPLGFLEGAAVHDGAEQIGLESIDVAYHLGRVDDDERALGIGSVGHHGSLLCI